MFENLLGYINSDNFDNLYIREIIENISDLLVDGSINDNYDISKFKELIIKMINCYNNILEINVLNDLKVEYNSKYKYTYQDIADKYNISRFKVNTIAKKYNINRYN